MKKLLRRLNHIFKERSKKLFHKVGGDKKFQKLDKLFKNEQSKKNYDNLITYLKHRFKNRFFAITDDNNIPMYSSDFNDNSYENYRSGRIIFSDKEIYKCLLKANINGKCEKCDSYSEHLGVNIYEKIIFFFFGGEDKDTAKAILKISSRVAGDSYEKYIGIYIKQFETYIREIGYSISDYKYYTQEFLYNLKDFLVANPDASFDEILEKVSELSKNFYKPQYKF